MASVNSKRLNNQFISEYKFFIENYLFRLLGIVNKNLIMEMYQTNMKKDTVEAENNKLLFFIGGWCVFSVETLQEISDDNLKLTRRIIQSFFQISEYKRTGSGKNNNYFSKTQRNTVFCMAVQKGICSWIGGDPQSNAIEKLFNKLETWSVKTYEGKKVTLGFIIDPNANKKSKSKYENWIDFLDDDSSAVLTDCIHSVIELDANCNFLNYRSISSRNSISSGKLSNRIPLRFTQVIQKYVTGKKFGIFLLNNGDIILARNQAVCFVKRNLQWLNLSYDAFAGALEDFVSRSCIEDDKQPFYDLIETIFASVLDVSFSHAGGIISIVGDSWPGSKSQNRSSNPVLHPCDDFLNDYDATTYSSEEKGFEATKRMQKRTILMNLTGQKRFFDLDRKLRSELISLDGACILNCRGEVISFGAIIQNDSGSTGGGRGAAAKKLSRYGMAVKISTDGYIELYVDGKNIYAIK